MHLTPDHENNKNKTNHNTFSFLTACFHVLLLVTARTLLTLILTQMCQSNSQVCMLSREILNL